MPADDVSIQRVIRAWAEPGPNPKYHNAARDRLRLEWPSLARALDLLVAPKPKE